MSIRGPYPQGPGLATPSFYHPPAPNYHRPYYSPSISSSSSSSSDSSSDSSSFSPATPDFPATYYSTIPAHYFNSSEHHSTGPKHSASQAVHPSKTSPYGTAHIEQQKSRGGDKQEKGKGVHQEPYHIEDDEMMAWRIHEEELAALQTETADFQHERDLQRALEESRRTAQIESQRSEKTTQLLPVHAGHGPSQSVMLTAGSVPRHGLSIPPPTPTQSHQANSTFTKPEISGSRVRPTPPAHPLLGYHSLFTEGQKCSQCNANIPLLERNGGSTLNYSSRAALGPLLHITCPSCAVIQCRGCTKAVTCPRRCTGGQQCSLPTCCQEIRAIAIFEVLVDFDKAFTDKVAELHTNTRSRAQHVLKANREEYLDLATSWADTRVSEPLRSMLTGVLSKLTHWLAGELHKSIGLLISTSHLLEVIQSFLSVPAASDWLKRRALYGQILDFLRYLATRHLLHSLVMSPRQDDQRTCILQNIMASATYLEDASPNLPKSIYEVAISNPAMKEMERFACRAHLPQLGQDAQVLWQGLKYLELVKALGSDTD